MPARIVSNLVWKEIEKRSFAVLSYVNPKGQARSAGIVYVVIDRVLYVRVAKASWKAKHILLNPHVALNVTISKRVPFIPWIKIPDATIADNCMLEIRPSGDFVTYGVGVSLLDMRDPEKARGRAPVG